MARSYRHIKQYEEELLKLKEEGFTVKEIGERFGLTYEQAHGFFKRHNKNQRKLEAGKALKKRGRPKKGEGLPPSVFNQSKVNQLKYELAEKERRIKRLEMENELMRDFLSLTGRK